MQHNYFVYILSNTSRSTLYVGVTNNIPKRMLEHKENKSGFAFKYHCFELVYYEHFTQIDHAIAREKQIKKWSRDKKEKLISSKNPKWNNLLPNFY